MKTAVVGSINMDMTVTAERILKGETLKGETSATYPSEGRQPGRCHGKAGGRCGDVRLCGRR